MNLIRQLLAVFLSAFLSFSAFAADNKKDSKEKNSYPYFKLGIRSVNPSGFVDWGRECVVVTTEDSPPVSLYYRSSGKIKKSALGIIKAPEAIIVSAATGFALRPRICGNGLADPTNWIPVGSKPQCSEGTVSVPETKPEPAKAAFVPIDLSKPLTIDVADPEYGWQLRPGGAKKLDFDLAKSEDYKNLLDEVARQNKRTRTTLYVVGAVVVGALVVGLICSSSGGSSKKSSGGPVGDPVNIIYFANIPR